MKATISPKLLARFLASSLLLGICVQAAAPREDSAEGTFTTIDFPGATLTVAMDINPAGEIVGQYVSAGHTHGFLRSKNGELTTVDFPDSVFTVAAGINPRGDIVGMYRLASDLPTARHGFLLSNGEFTTIDPPGALFTNALGINPRGDIVGRYCTTVTVPCTPNGNVHGFLLRESEFTTIDFPDPIKTGLDNGGINPSSDIVGFYCDTAPCTAPSTNKHGFLLSRGHFTTIDFPGARATAAFGINARGDIVGPYDDTSGKTHGFLLSMSLP